MITMEEWQAELDRLEQTARESDGDGLTSREIRELRGWSEDKTMQMVRAGVKSGRLIVGRAQRQNVVGVWRPEPVYVFKRAPDGVVRKKKLAR